MENTAREDILTCRYCGHNIMLSHDYEYTMYEHIDTGSIYCWDDSDQTGAPEIEEEEK
jgi:hypothetical protein